VDRSKLVLAVSADERLGTRVLEGVAQPGIDVLVARSAGEALRIAEERAPDLAVVDALLPDVSGLGFCRLLREHPRLRSTPILMLSAHRAEIDRVLAFEAEVDDYLPSDLSVRELSSRVRAILRRAQECPPEPASVVGREDSIGPVAGLDELGPGVGLLTPREREVVVTLTRANGSVLSRERILSEVWGSESLGARVVDAHVKNIRRKLGEAGRRLETVRGIGYRFRER
jgi:two-component system phosphate regulon response regulator PhoB